jgi:hypothetical protein
MKAVNLLSQEIYITSQSFYHKVFQRLPIKKMHHSRCRTYKRIKIKICETKCKHKIPRNSQRHPNL